MPDCGDNSCRYAHDRGGTSLSACRCDDCPECGAVIRPRAVRTRHRPGCLQPDWIPDHHHLNPDPVDLADDPAGLRRRTLAVLAEQRRTEFADQAAHDVTP